MDRNGNNYPINLGWAVNKLKNYYYRMI